MLDARVVKARRWFVVDIALQVQRGERCGLFGPSGAGKSTVLACLAGAETADGGYARVDDVQLFPPPLPLYRRPIGYLTQDANLFPHLDVEQNVRFGLKRTATATDEAWIAELRDRLQIASIWHARPHGISGGQARRVALARMLARRPALVLLDEPFTGLDRDLVRDLIASLLDWHTAMRFMLVVVDHDVEVLQRLCPRTIAVEEGRIVQVGTWDELRRKPATPLLERLIAPL